MPSPSWEITGGSSAVMFPVERQAGGRWRCKILNYPKLYLSLTEEEMSLSWQTAPRIDMKWINPGSRWIPLNYFFDNSSVYRLMPRVWPTVIRLSRELRGFTAWGDVHFTEEPVQSFHDAGGGYLREPPTVQNLMTRYVRLWDKRFPTEPTAFVAPPTPKRSTTRVRARPNVPTALDLILEDDD